MSQSHDVAGVVKQLLDAWGEKVIVDWQDFWSEHPVLQEDADEILVKMGDLYKALLGVE